MHRLSGDRRLFPPSLLRISTLFPHKINNPGCRSYLASRLSLACCMLHVNPAHDSHNRRIARHIVERKRASPTYIMQAPQGVIRTAGSSLLSANVCRKQLPRIAARSLGSTGQRSHHQGRGKYHDHHSKFNPDYRAVLSFSLLPSLYMLLPESLRGDGSNPDLSPYQYTRHTIHSVQRLGPQHLLLRIELSAKSRAMFDVDAAGVAAEDGKERASEVVTIQHVCVKSPDLQIERPYTPINDPAADGYMEFVVKRVRGGEVGR
jgi:hypothetical protein